MAICKYLHIATFQRMKKQNKIEYNTTNFVKNMLNKMDE